jgi:hypothetical protein
MYLFIEKSGVQKQGNHIRHGSATYSKVDSVNRTFQPEAVIVHPLALYLEEQATTIKRYPPNKGSRSKFQGIRDA